MEIERKYIVRGNDWREQVTQSYLIAQAYLSANPHCAIRIRLRQALTKTADPQGDGEAFITIKTLSLDGGLSREEYEYPIPLDDAKQLLQHATTQKITKIRHIIPMPPFKIELDEFLDDNKGLLLAEIELPDTKTEPPRPPFLAEEVTGCERYYNLFLAQHPYKTWF